LDGENRIISPSELTADLVGHEVIAQVQVVGCQDLKAIPMFFQLICDECDNWKKIFLQREPEVAIVTIGGTNKDAIKGIYRTYRACDEDHRFHVEASAEMIDLTVVCVRDLLDDGRRFTDRTSKVRELYLIGCSLPPGRKIEVRGQVAVHPKTKNLVIVASESRALNNEFETFNATDEQKAAFITHFQQRRDAHRQLAPNIVGQKRDLAKRWEALVHHSVYEIPNIYGRLIRGCLRTIHIGDSRTGKSDIAQEGTDDPRSSFPRAFGEKVTAETSSRTGILYTIDSDNGILKWGALPLNDRGFVALDGMQKFGAEEMGEYREALASEQVKVDRSQHGVAPMRVRQIACLNPRKPTLASYLFPCQALLDSRPFQDPVDLTRWDAAIPFDEGDVDIESIVASGSKCKPMDDEVYRDHVMWAWSREPDHIVYASGTREVIVERAILLSRKYSTPALPLVHNEIREILTRVAVATAVLYHSTDDKHEQVIVTPEHVEDAYTLMAETYDLLGLDRFREYQAGRLSIGGSEFVSMVIGLDRRHIDLLDAVALEPKSSAQLGELFGVDPVTIRRWYGDLSQRGLLDAGPKGVSLSERGHQFLHYLMGYEETKNRKDGARRSVTRVVTGLQPEALQRAAAMIEEAFATEASPKVKDIASALVDVLGVNAGERFEDACLHHRLPFIIEDGSVRRRTDLALIGR